MESMLEFLRGCLVHADLDTITKGDLKKSYLKDKRLTKFPVDDKKLFSEAVTIALQELDSENNGYNVENELDSKVEDVVTEEVSDDNVHKSPIESDSKDFAPDNIEISSSITEPALKKKSCRKILSDSEMSADEQDKSNVVVIKEEVNIGSGIFEAKANSLSSLSENNENSGDTTYRMPNKKKGQKLISDDESSLDVPVERKSIGRKRLHSSSSSENDADFSSNESSSFKTPTPKRKKIKVSVDSQEKNSRKFSHAMNTSKDKGKIISSSDSEEEIASKPMMKKTSTASIESGTKSMKKNFSDSEEEPLASLKKKSLVPLNQSEDESDSTLINTESGKSCKVSDKQDTSEFEDEMLTNFECHVVLKDVLMKQNASESENEPLTNFGKQKKLGETVPGNPKKQLDKQDTSESEDEPLSNFNKEKKLGKTVSGKPIKELDKWDTSESEDEPLTKFAQSKKDALSKSRSLQKNISSESEDKPIVNSGKKASKKTPNKMSSEKKGKEMSDSDDEPLKEKLNTSRDKKADKSSLDKESSSQSSSSADENEEGPISKKDSKPSKKEKVSKSVKGKKRLSASENKIENLKKYIRAAGIRVKSYTQLFEKCKSMKAKCEKLSDLLEQHGMKGRPTLEKCKKIKKKIETKKEIAELDLSNILKTEGRRSKRSACSDATNYEKVEKALTPVKRFSRLKDIIDSEGSD